ncbi:MAG: AEC family transporter [Pseudomonadota bacterium]
MDSVSITVVLPLFMIMLAGYVAGHYKLLSEGSSAVLSRFVFNFSLPALVFANVSTLSVASFFDWSFIGALGGGMGIVMLLGFLAARFVFKHDLNTAGFHALSSMHSSTAYIGLPVVLSIFGDAGLAPGIIGAVITGAVFMPIGILAIEAGIGKRKRQSPLRVIAKALGRPPIIATAAGLCVSAVGWSLPPAVMTFCETLGGAFIPCALFAAGLFLPGRSWQGARGEIAWLVSIKLLVHPAVTFILAFYIFELSDVLLTIAVLQAALPTGVPVFVLAQQYRQFVVRSSTVIVLSTLLSLATLSTLLLIFRDAIG